LLKISKQSSFTRKFQYDIITIFDNGVRFWSHPVYIYAYGGMLDLR